MSFDPMSHLPYLPIEPFSTGFMSVGDGHHIYYEECGDPNGVPVIFLHGGPGSGCSASHRRLFNPHLCRVILFDQRGCGRSVASDRLQANTSVHLVADIEQLRLHLHISKWVVTGGSWGAGLALAYATAYPSACFGLVLRSVFLGRSADIDWFFHGAKHLLPDAWSALIENISCTQLLGSMQDPSSVTQWQMMRRWQAWENALTQRQFTAAEAGMCGEVAQKTIEKYQLQSHYLLNTCFWQEQPLLERLVVIEHLHVTILHGRLDWVCRPSSAWELHQKLPLSQLHWLDTCGHGPYESPMAFSFAQAVAHHCQNLASAPA
jgi:proline iminopeptidase